METITRYTSELASLAGGLAASALVFAVLGLCLTIATDLLLAPLYGARKWRITRAAPRFVGNVIRFAFLIPYWIAKATWRVVTA
ncbi:MAG: hypothetical protein COU11_02090 [Candidatus Harrisonbacteria bacterium CG10_big_fil_rev_8_21_14_0_10_49_15]|uniref:Uncharacterized protein n=1 Tax=Candidatus Harrisonbacteria bacterium CG10_big_fil_rev_8_21_14_0_10_49_15 TaxID=1974587 RepID=A0A2H0UKR5_9BACT|nr:MAG: hypothetical protein COU11_02090 [Candidatus Harrisonbacteria bacterium CG10_big_fil_rev_8_21_14_0_10_49_15]